MLFVSVPPPMEKRLRAGLTWIPIREPLHFPNRHRTDGPQDSIADARHSSTDSWRYHPETGSTSRSDCSSLAHMPCSCLDSDLLQDLIFAVDQAHPVAFVSLELRCTSSPSGTPAQIVVEAQAGFERDRPASRAASCRASFPER